MAFALHIIHGRVGQRAKVRRAAIVVPLMLFGVLSGCGDTQNQQTASGAAIGAGAGAVIYSANNDSAAAGALTGGILGGVVGAFFTPR